MILFLYLYFPVFICLVWVLIHTVLASRTDSYKLFAALFLSCGLYIYSEACHALLEPSSAMNLIAILVGQLAGPCVVPLLILYIRRLVYPRRDNPLTYAWLVVPAVLFTAGSLLYVLEGFEKADNLFHLFTGRIYNIVLAANLAILVMYSVMALFKRTVHVGTAFKFFFKGGKIRTAYLQALMGVPPMVVMLLRVGLHNNLYSLDRWIVVVTATVLSISAFMFGLFALFGQKSYLRISEVGRLVRFNYNHENKADVIEEMLDDLLDEAEDEALKRVQAKIGENLHIDQWKAGDLPKQEAPRVASRIFNAMADSWDEGSLISRFQHLMLEEQLFLQPRLTLDDVAERLNTNKTYISKLVNNTYNLSFPELINTLRIDYAEQYILSHRDVKQEEIAANCGFLSASSFNTIFKKVTGMTPMVWIGLIERQNTRS